MPDSVLNTLYTFFHLTSFAFYLVGICSHELSEANCPEQPRAAILVPAIANQGGTTQAQANCQKGWEPTLLSRIDIFCCMKIEDREGAFPSSQLNAVGSQKKEWTILP